MAAKNGCQRRLNEGSQTWLRTTTNRRPGWLLTMIEGGQLVLPSFVIYEGRGGATKSRLTEKRGREERAALRERGDGKKGQPWMAADGDTGATTAGCGEAKREGAMTSRQTGQGDERQAGMAATGMMKGKEGFHRCNK